LTPDASGLTGIPEGGFEATISSSSYDDTSISSYNTEIENIQEIVPNETWKMDLCPPAMQSPILRKEHSQLQINENVSV